MRGTIPRFELYSKTSGIVKTTVFDAEMSVLDEKPTLVLSQFGNAACHKVLETRLTANKAREIAKWFGRYADWVEELKKK